MSDIQDEAYTEAMEEIERLEQLNDDLIADKNRITDFAKAAITEKDAEIEQLKSDVIKLYADAQSWRLLVKRYTCELSSYPLIDELLQEGRDESEK